MLQARPYQLAAKKALYDAYRANPKARPIISMPTGAGKGTQIALIVEEIRKHKPDFRFLIVSHTKEIISQNTADLQKLLAEPIGIYSAGLGVKTIRKITCANVQSIYKKAKNFSCDMLIIDEVHRANAESDSMYKKLIDGLSTNNPDIKIFGLSASPYRMDMGSLVGGFFTEICYDVSITELIEQEFLSNVISLPAGEKIDFSGVKKSGFDYQQSELEKIMSPLVLKHAEDIKEKTANRKSVLVFCSGVKHAEDICKALGDSADYVTGEMLAMLRDRKINDFKTGKIKYLCNVEILTTGFNYPALDCIVLLRATRSTSLFVQMVGRGMRVATGKKDCLLLDYASNLDSFGPIDTIKVPRKKKENGKLDFEKAPTKECPSCGCVVHPRLSVCPNCGADLLNVKLSNVASSAPVISQAELMTVDSVEYKIHRKGNIPENPAMLKITYRGGAKFVMDFLCFDHGGYASQMARKKWAMLGGNAMYSGTTLNAFNHTGDLKKPAEIEIKRDGKYYRVLRVTKEREVDTELEAFREKYGF